MHQRSLIPRLPSPRRLRLFDAIGIIVVLAWSWVLVVRWTGPDEGQDSRVRLDGEAGLTVGDEWQGLYMAGEKVGFLHLRKELLPGGEGWRVSSELRLRLLVLGKHQELDVDLEAALDPMLLLRTFRTRVRGGGAGDLEVGGVVQGQMVQLSFRSAGELRTQTVKLARPPTLELAARPLLARDGLAVGKRLSVEFFDPLSQSPRKLQATVIDEEEVIVMAEPVRTYVLLQDLDGLALKAWITATGEVVREELPLGILAMRETEEEARHGTYLPPGPGASREAGRAAGSSSLPDVVKASSVPVHGNAGLLAGPRVRLRLLGLGLAETGAERLALDGGRQRLEGEEIVVEREPLLLPETRPVGGLLPRPVASPPPPVLVPSSTAGTIASSVGEVGVSPVVAEEELLASLRPEPLLQADHPEIVAQAQRVVGTSTEPARKVSLLVDWLDRALDKTGIIGVPSALDVLRNRRGDCNEHATLFVALARAAAIPARLLAGLVYMPEHHRFFYHAWAEVWLEGRWVEIDPTFGQAPASAARVRMVRGGLDRQVELLRVIGRLRAVEVLPPGDLRTTDPPSPPAPSPGGGPSRPEESRP
ncbi:MAG: transglutaminase domain-containing protein [Deltaproteobacteria bacterium]|nr:transglutaminase domain-containing protein [Deltaproteobacteria bacterium]